MSSSSTVPASSASASPSPGVRLHVLFGRHDLDEEALSEEGGAASGGTNKPVVRKRRILDALMREAKAREEAAKGQEEGSVKFEGLTTPAPSLAPAELVHNAQMLALFSAGFDRWAALGDAGRDLYFTTAGRQQTPDWSDLIPSASAPRDLYQRAPKGSIHAEVNYFCQDRTTPITANTSALLHHDLAVSLRAVESITAGEAREVYACTTQPGHHSGRDSYGGYCFINQASLCARLLSSHYGKAALIDVDYHAGNGSMSILYEVPDVFFASIHADPLISYPYTCGFEDQRGGETNPAARNGVLNVCLGQGTTWKEYAPALQKVLDAVKAFGAQALVVSLGVDTLHADPEAAPAGGFSLRPADYDHMGRMVREAGLPTIWVQEGGYKLDEAGDIVRHVLLGASLEEQAAAAQAQKQ